MDACADGQDNLKFTNVLNVEGDFFKLPCIDHSRRVLAFLALVAGDIGGKAARIRAVDGGKVRLTDRQEVRAESTPGDFQKLGQHQSGQHADDEPSELEAQAQDPRGYPSALDIQRGSFISPLCSSQNVRTRNSFVDISADKLHMHPT